MDSYEEFPLCTRGSIGENMTVFKRILNCRMMKDDILGRVKAGFDGLIPYENYR